MKNKKTFLILCLFTAIFTVFIWYNSAISAKSSGNISKIVAELVLYFAEDVSTEEFDAVHLFIRKAAHFTEFCILGILYGTIRRKIDGKIISFLIFFPISCTLFTAVCDEFIQSFTGRGSSVRDIMLDFAGALTGIFITVALVTVSENSKCRLKFKIQ